jgi:hypothetical protein
VVRRFVFRTPADQEYLVLPEPVRLTFEAIQPALVRHPFLSGAGFTVASVRRHPGLWKLKLTDFPPRIFCAVYEVDGQLVRFLGCGPRPDFYRRLGQKDRFARSRS